MALQQRFLSSATAAAFFFVLTKTAKEFLLREGTDVKYGARHLKRTIDAPWCTVVNLHGNRADSRPATWISVDLGRPGGPLVFYRKPRTCRLTQCPDATRRHLAL